MEDMENVESETCCISCRKVFTKKFWIQPPDPKVGPFFWITLVLSIISHLVAVVLNLVTLYRSVVSRDWWYFSILLATMVLAQIPIGLFSYWWHRRDSHDRCVSLPVRILHLLMFAFVRRTYLLGRQARQCISSKTAVDYHCFYLMQADLSFLRLVAVYVASAPQLVFKLYRLMELWTTDGNVSYFLFFNVRTPLSVVSSEVIFAMVTAVSLALSTMSYSKAARQHRYDKRELSYGSMLLQCVYRVCFLASRIVALLFLFRMGLVFACVVCLCLLIVLFIWFRCMKTDFTENGRQEFVFHCLMSFIHLFGMLNMKDDPARARYAWYYTVSLIGEFAVLLTFASTERGYCLLPLFILLFFVGLLCHHLEHGLFHPGEHEERALYSPRLPSAWEDECEVCMNQPDAAVYSLAPTS